MQGAGATEDETEWEQPLTAAWDSNVGVKPGTLRYDPATETEYRREYKKWELKPQKAFLSDWKRIKTGPFMGSPTSSEFKAWGGKPPEPFVPKDVSGATGLPFDGVSTARASFPGWAPGPPPATKGSMPYVPNRARLDARTTVSESFQHDPSARPAERFKPKDRSFAATGLPFEATSTSRTEFQPWEGGRPSTPVHKTSKPHKSIGPFMGRSLSRDTFVPHSGTQPPKPYIPKHQVHVKGLPFEGQSVMRSEFPAFESRTVIKHRPVEAFKPSKVKFEAKSIAQDSYRPWGGKPPEPFVPKDVSGATGLPFDGVSTARASFPGWAPGPPPATKGSMPYVPNRARLDGRTTVSESFQHDPSARPAERFKPKDRALVKGTPFGGNTTYRESFVRWDGARPSTPVLHTAKPYSKSPETRDFKSNTRLAHDKLPRVTRPGEIARIIARAPPGSGEPGPNGATYYRNLTPRGRVYVKKGKMVGRLKASGSVAAGSDAGAKGAAARS